MDSSVETGQALVIQKMQQRINQLEKELCEERALTLSKSSAIESMLPVIDVGAHVVMMPVGTFVRRARDIDGVVHWIFGDDLFQVKHESLPEAVRAWRKGQR